MTHPSRSSPVRPEVEAAKDLIARLQRRLALGRLPGREAQRSFEPELAFGRHAGPSPFDARRAAVMILLYPHDGQWFIPLTVRPDHMTAHGGQISLPGGLIEPEESARDAAVRELHEELNVDPNSVRTLGPLSPLYVFGTKFDVEPWVGATDHRPAFAPNVGEVATLFEAPLDHLLDSRNHGEHSRIIRGIAQTVPHLEFEGHRIWGATAMILGEFLALVREALAEAGEATP